MRPASSLALVLVLAFVAACSTSPSAPSCQNPTAAEQACNTCSGSSCSSQVSALTSQCPGYVSCYEACDCGDATCLAGCAALIVSSGGATDTCSSAASSLALCVQFNCPATACAPLVDAGQSGVVCGAGAIVCRGSCVNPESDTNNCGECGVACGASMQCTAGVCGCSLGYDTVCNGSCVDEANDPFNCGGCGVQCQTAESCVSGKCECTGAGSMCSGTCVDEQTDVDNCGACGVRCPTAQAGGPIRCQAGACACPSGRSVCGGVFCVDKQTDPLNCGACGAACGAATPECSRGSCIKAPVPNCAPGGPGLNDCGAAAESCCTSVDVIGGTFFRTYDPTTPDAGTTVGPDGGGVGEADPATVSTFSLDKYLVTVGRFRQFVNAWNEYTGYYPPAGSGTHAYLNGGKGLVVVTAAAGDGGLRDGAPGEAGATDAGAMDATLDGGGTTYEPGWATTDNAEVAPTDKALACDPNLATWTPTPGSNEKLPITCVTWQESYAFCVWDGGFLPSEAEWAYAAAGGSQQLEYPWGSAPPGASNQYAIYGNGAGQCFYPTGALAACAGVSSIAPVGTATLGAGLWGQLDMAGELQQWTLDGYAPFLDPSTDGVYVGGTTRSLRGSNFGSSLVPNPRADAAPNHRFAWVGFRCARAP